MQTPLLDELLGGTWTAPAPDDDELATVDEMQALLGELVAELEAADSR